MAGVGLARIAVVLPARSREYDFAHYYLSAKLLLDGANPYTTSLKEYCWQFGFPYYTSLPHATNPPPLIWLFVPLALLPPAAAFWIWVAMQAVSLGVMLYLLKRLLRPHLTTQGWLWMSAAIIASEPVLLHFLVSHVELLLGALLLIAYTCRRNERHLLASLLAAGAGLLKPNALVLLPWFLWVPGKPLRRQGARVLAVLASVALGLWVSRPALWVDFVREALPLVARHAWQATFNLSLPSLVMTFGHDFPAGPIAVAALGVGLAMTLIAYGICWWARTDDEGQFCLLLVSLLVGGPVAWGYYYVYLIFPVAVFATRIAARPSFAKLAGAGFVLILLNSMGTWRWTWSGLGLRTQITLSFLPLYGAMALGAFFAGELIATRLADGRARP